MIRLRNLLAEVTTTHGSAPLDGKSKRSASNFVHSKVDKFTRGKFSDNYWQPVQQIFKEFDRLGFRWTPTGASYEEERVRLADGSHATVPVRKVWTFEIEFVNANDKDDKLHGQVVAAGAGPADDPLANYDVTLTVS